MGIAKTSPVDNILKVLQVDFLLMGYPSSSLKGFMYGSSIGVLQGDIRSLDCGSYT